MSNPEGYQAVELSPLRVRLVAFVVMIAVAIASIWLIDQRAMQRQAEIEASQTQAERDE